MKFIKEMLNSMTNDAFSLLWTMKSATSETSDSVQLAQRNPLQKNSVQLGVKNYVPVCFKKSATTSVPPRRTRNIRVPN